LLTGDVIIEIDSRPVASAEEFICAVRMRLPGSAIRLTTIRGAATREVLIVLARKPDDVILTSGQCEPVVSRAPDADPALHTRDEMVFASTAQLFRSAHRFYQAPRAY
jgi:hypothetical protein